MPSNDSTASVEREERRLRPSRAGSRPTRTTARARPPTAWSASQLIELHDLTRPASRSAAPGRTSARQSLRRSCTSRTDPGSRARPGDLGQPRHLDLQPLLKQTPQHPPADRAASHSASAGSAAAPRSAPAARPSAVDPQPRISRLQRAPSATEKPAPAPHSNALAPPPRSTSTAARPPKPGARTISNAASGAVFGLPIGAASGCAHQDSNPRPPA